MADISTTSQTISSDDASVLRVLLHTIKGISPVSTTEFITVQADEQ